jgi:ATP-dependent 26S proteasome regulatory subunit
MERKEEVPKWFETFFNSISNSPEFKAMTWDFDSIRLEKELKKMDKTIKKAWSIMSNFSKSFDSKEVREAWNTIKSSDYSNVEQKFSKASDEQKEENKIEVKYFKNENPKTYWFLWIAWLDDLKQELKESFINPLKFKFLVENLEKNWNLSKKEELYKKLHNAYEKLKVTIPTGLLMYGPPWTGKTF